ncbi:hypothetical protein [Mesorhizobium sp. M0208]|uniref:hypothetical protein n=1 Tax=Mesorhizobium sp. M0208 TaxID=2956916 RepID=UPI00333A0181
MDDTAIDGTKKEKQMPNPHRIAFYGKGRSAKPPPTKQARRLGRTLAQEILMAGSGSKACHTRFILNSKAQDNVLHLAAGYA